VATTASLHPEPFTARRFSSLSFVIEASRPGLWATAVWFYLLPLGRRHVVDTPGFWFGLVYVTLPLGLIIYGWNDIADATIDQLNPRKGSFLFGARGSQDQLARLPLKIALAQAIFAVLFMLFTGPKILIWFSGLIAFTAIYNFPRHGLKQNPPFDILNQAGYLLVFVLSSWLNHAPQLRWRAMLFGALFAMHSHVFGEVMDIVPDRAGGRRTTATVIGAVPSKLLISGMLAIEAILIYINHSDCWIIGALAFGAVWFVLDALLLWRDRPYSLRTMQAFMLGWNAIALGSMGWIWSNAVFIH
jgi:4-hydroxybenzoate polyprenyltransferase